MKIVVLAALTLAALVASPASRAHLQNPNERARIVFTGPHDLAGQAGQVVEGAFSVRVEDVEGRPMPGVNVWFFPNLVYSLGGGTVGGHPGDFLDTVAALEVFTDADGVATAPAFRFAGSGDVAAGVYGFHPYNTQVVGYPPLVALFHVNRSGVVEPPEQPWPPRAPAGGPPEAVPLPLLSWQALAALAVLLGGCAAVHPRLRRVRR